MQSQLNRQGLTWGRTTLNIMNLTISTAMLGLLIYIAVNLNYIVNNVIQIILKNVDKSKPAIIQTSSDIATGVLENKSVNDALTNIISTQTEPIIKMVEEIKNPTSNIPGPNGASGVPSQPNLMI